MSTQSNNIGLKSQMYHTLSGDTPQIRLLELEPSGSLTNPMSCHLRMVNIDEASDFIALSYVWGDESQEQTFVINGERIQATNNLYLALRKIRAAWASILSLDALKSSKLHSYLIGPLWVDAICIYSHRPNIKTLRNLKCFIQLNYAFMYLQK
jgi:heterokaryon incompatibility protein (HET)